MKKYTLFFILNGYVNGSKDECAPNEYVLTGDSKTERRMPDGHYWVFIGGEVEDAEGPYDHIDAAREAAEATPQTWAFPIGLAEPYQVIKDPSSEDDVNCASVTSVFRAHPGGGIAQIYRFELLSSYENLTLEITTRELKDAVGVYAQLLQIAAPFQ